ncbi:hypothetical protein PILCRDRAFT_133181 [Piloderma croceum F 1598]|uniref:Uncharacterized protein n=1 Tax=Piloderma croceum (strain F 1598) TaxID=765440 RepID=A0A0C3GLX6_PILCF|nr:hypothetical protein PILCRDRAFT_133181 [Piloderma croceum F 1598]
MGPDSYLPEADLKANIINPLEMLLSNDVIDAMERQGFRDEVSAVKAFRKIVDDMVQETKFRSTNHLATSFALSDSDTSILQQLCTALKSVDTSRLRDIVSNPDNPIPETEILADILQLHGKFQKLIRFHKVFEGLFFDQPFQVSAGNLYGLRPREEHLALQFNPTWSQRHSTIMKDMGQIWVDNHLRAVRVEDHLRAATVEDHLRAVTVEDVEKVQISLIQNLSEAIRDELFAFKSIPETTESLLHIQATIKKEVARVRNAKFIIAFCGMVKAGCVRACSSV